MIRCDRLTRYYGSYAAVDHLTLEIPRGAVCALVGPNGAGKTTTMRMLSTLLPPSHGRAGVGGHDIRQDPEGVRRLIGYLPEAFQMYEDLSVERYLTFFALAYGLDRDTARGRSQDFLERLGLKEKRSARIGTLSRGMKQRLGVAKSFLHDPEVVLLDEPASGLDPVARTELRDFLKYEQWLGKTIVVSSHVLRELADFCDFIVILNQGRLSECGPLAGANGILAKYADIASGGKPYTLRVLKDAPRLELLLQGAPGVSHIKRRDQTLSFELAGDEEAAGQLLGRIAGAGYLVTRFAPEEVDLEAVYRRASEGEPRE
jgi:ABC-2 type transport system ATP-binding protein